MDASAPHQCPVIVTAQEALDKCDRDGLTATRARARVVQCALITAGARPDITATLKSQYTAAFDLIERLLP